jgi:hypothetical protein
MSYQTQLGESKRYAYKQSKTNAINALICIQCLTGNEYLPHCQTHNTLSDLHQPAYDPTPDFDQDPTLCALRLELEQTKQNAPRRESEVIAEVMALRELNKRNQPKSPPNCLPFISAEVLAMSSPKNDGRDSASRHDEDDDGGEKSMDLASPLLPLFNVLDPTPVLIDSDTPITREGIDASLIPLPRSPVNSASELELESPRALTLQDRPPTPFSLIPKLQKDGDSSAGT